MIQSMTGFGRAEKKIQPYGIVSVEIRSINHKFLESVIHVPEGFLSLEDKIKKEIETRIVRGRLTCVINIVNGSSRDVAINEQLIKKYLTSINSIAKKYGVGGEVNINNLITLPGVLSLTENRLDADKLWAQVKTVLHKALSELLAMRNKEGKALLCFLKERNDDLRKDIDEIKARYKKTAHEKAAKFSTDAERAAFLKETDITEEVERLDYHIANFKTKFTATGPIGKELDFISQEMQREANTMGAKTCDAYISGKVIEIKSHIEKTREQLQNIV